MNLHVWSYIGLLAIAVLAHFFIEWYRRQR
jgi:hypothetical protein